MLKCVELISSQRKIVIIRLALLLLYILNWENVKGTHIEKNRCSIRVTLHIKTVYIRIFYFQTCLRPIFYMIYFYFWRNGDTNMQIGRFWDERHIFRHIIFTQILIYGNIESASSYVHPIFNNNLI